MASSTERGRCSSKGASVTRARSPPLPREHLERRLDAGADRDRDAEVGEACGRPRRGRRSGRASAPSGPCGRSGRGCRRPGRRRSSRRSARGSGRAPAWWSRPVGHRDRGRAGRGDLLTAGPERRGPSPCTPARVAFAASSCWAKLASRPCSRISSQAASTPYRSTTDGVNGNFSPSIHCSFQSSIERNEPRGALGFSRMRSQASSLTLISDMPGGPAMHFWAPATQMSSCHSSGNSGMPPSDETQSTKVRHAVLLRDRADLGERVERARRRLRVDDADELDLGVLGQVAVDLGRIDRRRRRRPRARAARRRSRAASSPCRGRTGPRRGSGRRVPGAPARARAASRPRIASPCMSRMSCLVRKSWPSLRSVRRKRLEERRVVVVDDRRGLALRAPSARPSSGRR